MRSPRQRVTAVSGVIVVPDSARSATSCDQLPCVPSWVRASPLGRLTCRRKSIERAAIFHSEPKRSIVEHLEDDTTIVHLPMVVAA
jgi:hypothetical protein